MGHEADALLRGQYADDVPVTRRSDGHVGTRTKKELLWKDSTIPDQGEYRNEWFANNVAQWNKP